MLSSVQLCAQPRNSQCCPNVPIGHAHRSWSLHSDFAILAGTRKILEVAANGMAPARACDMRESADLAVSARTRFFGCAICNSVLSSSLYAKCSSDPASCGSEQVPPLRQGLSQSMSMLLGHARTLRPLVCCEKHLRN